MRKLSLLYFFILYFIITNAQLSNRIDSLAKAYVAKGFNGNVFYSKNDSILFANSYGYSDFSTKKPLNIHTIFELGSCSKQFTALAIVQLVEKDLVNYNTRVSEIIEDFPYDNITVEHLLRHQLGLPDYQKILYDKRNWDRKKQATNQDVIKVLSKLKIELKFKPGSQYEYNNTGYVILGSIIEKLSNTFYEKYIEEHIFKPVGMFESRVQNNEKFIPDYENIALGYTYNDKKKKYRSVEKDKNHKHIHWMNRIVGPRGIYSSILDLEKWKKALHYNTLISEKSKQQMFTTDSISKKYGYGFAIYLTNNKGKWVYHNGSWSGYKTMALYLPESNEYLTILSNNRYEEVYSKFEADFYKLIQ
ncbi:serine hydrolase [Flavobacteriaceae bacterium R38]|nr:serine hydrolase [Flavobacteriaceae bacterium R38]